MEYCVPLLYDAICPQLTTLITKTVLRRVVACKKLHQRSLPGIASFVRKTFIHLQQRAWRSVASFASWKLDITACRWPHLPSSEDPTIIRQSLAQSQKTASLRIHYRYRELSSCYSWKLEFTTAHHFEMLIAKCAQPRSQGPLFTSRKYPGCGWSRVC